MRNCTVLFIDLAQSSCCELEQATGYSLKHFQNGTFPKKSLAIKLTKTLSLTRESRRYSTLLWLLSSVSLLLFREYTATVTELNQSPKLFTDLPSHTYEPEWHLILNPLGLILYQPTVCSYNRVYLGGCFTVLPQVNL